MQDECQSSFQSAITEISLILTTKQWLLDNIILQNLVNGLIDHIPLDRFRGHCQKLNFLTINRINYH